MRIFKKIVFYLLIVSLTAGTTLYFSYTLSKQRKIEHKPHNMNVWIEDVLKLSIVEVQVSQIHSFESEGLKIYDFSLPFTQQQSLVVTEGRVALGYDVSKINIDDKGAVIEIELPPISIQSVDLDFKFVSEKDPMLNRITPKMRNKMMADIKAHVTATVIKNHVQTIKDKRKSVQKLLQAVSQKTIILKQNKD